MSGDLVAGAAGRRGGKSTKWVTTRDGSHIRSPVTLVGGRTAHNLCMSRNGGAPLALNVLADSGAGAA